MNKVILFGNLTKDPECLDTKSDTTVAILRLAVNATAQKTDFLDVKLFGKSAETAITHLEKGRSVLVEGKLETSVWEKDGKKNYSLDIVGRDWYFTDRKRTNDDD